jgi:hypothetical protein
MRISVFPPPTPKRSKLLGPDLADGRGNDALERKRRLTDAEGRFAVLAAAGVIDAADTQK